MKLLRSSQVKVDEYARALEELQRRADTENDELLRRAQRSSERVRQVRSGRNLKYYTKINFVNFSEKSVIEK